MHTHSRFDGARAWRRRVAWAALVGLSFAWSAGAAQADACESCPEPTLDDVRKAAPDVKLEERNGLWASMRDTLETDAGECSYALAGPPSIQIGKTWLVLRGQGSVWNCPWGRSEDEISFEIATGDVSGWSLDASLGASLTKWLLNVVLDVDFSKLESHTIHEVRKVTKTLAAGFGHVLDWSGYFELADVTADLDVQVTRRWSWWTKNLLTGDVVHQSGSVWMDCGNENARLTRRASIGYTFRLLDTPCDQPDAPPIDLGQFPRHPDPVITPDEGFPVPENQEDDEQPVEEPIDPHGDEPPAPDDSPAPPEPAATTTPGEALEPVGGDLGAAPTGALAAPPELEAGPCLDGAFAGTGLAG